MIGSVTIDEKVLETLTIVVSVTSSNSNKLSKRNKTHLFKKDEKRRRKITIRRAVDIITIHICSGRVLDRGRKSRAETPPNRKGTVNGTRHCGGCLHIEK